MGLRERKKQEMRERLSGTATRLFVERGFDAVRVAEVAEACGVSEKTVFNYFPTKEALLLDRLEATTSALRAALADPGTSPLDAALRLLDGELTGMTGSPDGWQAGYRRFGDLIRETPSLRAYQNDMTDRFVTVATEALAERAGVSPDEPEPQIAAAALLGLWRVQFSSLRRHVDPQRSPAEIRRLVSDDVRRAGNLLSTIFQD